MDKEGGSPQQGVDVDWQQNKRNDPMSVPTIGASAQNFNLHIHTHATRGTGRSLQLEILYLFLSM